MTPQEAHEEYNRRLKACDYKIPEILTQSTIEDVCSTQEFSRNLIAYINEQKMTRESILNTRKKIRDSGRYPAPEHRPTIDRILESGLMDNPQNFVDEYVKVVRGKSNYPEAMRTYIIQLGNLAYRMTIEQYICYENPDMANLVKLSQQRIDEKKSNIRKWHYQFKWWLANVYGRIKRFLQGA